MTFRHTPRKIMVVKQFTFDSAHYLPGYDGLCRQLHGHTYRLLVGYLGPVKTNGMVIDFTILKKEVGKIVELMDHTFLNGLDNLADFPTDMPTAENMVHWLIPQLQLNQLLPAELVFIRLYETPTSYAEWRKS